MNTKAGKSRRNNNGKAVLLSPAEWSVVVMFVFLAGGVIIGSIVASAMDSGLLAKVSKNVEAGFSNLVSGFIGANVFKASMFKYCRMIILVWVLTFVWSGAFVQLFIIGFKGFSIGYMVSVFIMEFGVQGLLISAGMFVVQNIAIVFMCMFITQPALVSVLEQVLKRQGRFSAKEQLPMGILEKLIILLICLALTMVIALYEAYVCPALFLRLR